MANDDTDIKAALWPIDLYNKWTIILFYVPEHMMRSTHDILPYTSHLTVIILHF